MAQHYEAYEIYEKLENQLKICKWESINNGEYFQIELPVVLYFNYQRLRLSYCLLILPPCVAHKQTKSHNSLYTKYITKTNTYVKTSVCRIS